MTGNDVTGNEGRLDMAEWEAQVNALLDGELDELEADSLKAAAEQDQALARAIIEAYQLQRLMAQLPRERAPDSLRRKLRAIPREQGAAHPPPKPDSSRHESPGRWFDWLRQPQWAGALAAIPLVALLVLSQTDQEEAASAPPTTAEIAQARQDLALAFAYLERAGRATERQIDMNIDRSMMAPVTEEMVRAIEEPFDLDENGQAEQVQRQEREA
jgi:anti-sigma factor RsiW